MSADRLADRARQRCRLHAGRRALHRPLPTSTSPRWSPSWSIGESVPFLPVLRYNDAGLRKRAEWERTWELQRQEDAIDARTKLPRAIRTA